MGESAQQPLRYYDYNVNGSVALAEVTAEVGCYRIVFSACRYGADAPIPYVETLPTSACNVWAYQANGGRN